MGKHKISAASSTPLSEQLANKIRNEILSGKLMPDRRLDSVRDLAESAGIDPMTAHAAVRILKDQGLVITAGAKGTFVSPNAVKLARAHSQALAKRQIVELFTRLSSLGIPARSFKKLIYKTLAELEA